jgi:polysaccharide export outer membrane protein
MFPTFRKPSAALLLTPLLTFASVACGPPKVPPLFQDTAVAEVEYRVAPADVIVVRVWKNPELSVEAPILPDGTLTVPLAGAVHAEGLTTGALEDLIAQGLADYITAPEVSVIVNQVNSKRVSVIGEVNRSGPQTLALDSRIVDALSQASGFTTFANRRKVKLIRRTDGGAEEEFRFDFDAYQAGRAPGTNVRLLPGDVIVVPD